MTAFKKNLLRLALGLLGIGLIIVIIALGCGGSLAQGIDSTAGESVSEVTEYKTEEINSLDINLSAATVEIREGTDWKVEVTGEKEAISVTLEEGTLEIKDKNRNYFHVWPLTSWDYQELVTVTVPKEAQLQEVDLEISAGEITGTGLTTRDLEVTQGAGSCELKDSRVTGKTTMDISAGKACFMGGTFAQVEMEVSAGTGIIEGAISGDVEVEVSAGDAEIHTDFPESYYQYKVDSSAGDVIINGKSLASHGEHHESAPGTAVMELKVSAGDIKVTTK